MANKKIEAKSSISNSSYESLILRAEKELSVNRTELQLFLPMLKEAENILLNFTTADNAKRIIELLESRASTKSKTVLNQAEEEYLHYLERMRLELSQLFELTSPHIHSQIKIFIEQEISWLKKQLTKAHVLNSIKESNNYTVTKKLSRDGEIRKFVNKRLQEDKTDLAFLKSERLDTYLDLLQFILQDFMDAASVFIDPSHYYNVSRRKYPQGYLYQPPELVNGIIREDKWNSFIAVCNYFIEGHTYSYKDFKNFDKKKIIPEKKYWVIEYDNTSDVYVWKGFGSEKSKSLRDFIKLLFQLEIFEVVNRSKQGRAFLDFFHVKRTDASYLFRTIFSNEVTPYTGFFEQAKPELKSIIEVNSKNSKTTPVSIG